MDKPIIIAHRINTIPKSREVPREYGVEIDIRGARDGLYLNHDPLDNRNYEKLGSFLEENKKRPLIIFNIKEAGIERKVIENAKFVGIGGYFLLDVEFPFLYQATRGNLTRKIAVRYSEAEPIEAVEAQIDREGRTLLDWVWIDTNTTLPLDKFSNNGWKRKEV
jgi:hypothetical protein